MKIEYAVGLGFTDDEDSTAYDELAKLPDSAPVKHELMAHLLILAARLEWRHADGLRASERASLRAREAAKRRKDRKHGGP